MMSGSAFDKEINLSASPILLLEPSFERREKESIESVLPEGDILLVADADTFAAAGKRFADALGFRARTRVFEMPPSPTRDAAEALTNAAYSCASLLAIGSGTINDLCKYAAFTMHLPYAVVATAPSMNGYASANASMIMGGWRTSLAAHPPVAVLAELEVLAQAPIRLIRSGLGDSLCRSTAQADWLLSHHLLGTAYDPRPYALLAEYEDALFACAGDLPKGDLRVIELLFRTLIASGEGMRLAGGSDPASQGEHMIAHTLEMMGHASGHHGEQIGVTTLTMAERQERLLEMPSITVQGDDSCRVIHEIFGEAVGRKLLESYALKRRSIDMISTIDRRWENAVAAIGPVVKKREYLRAVLESCDAPCSPGELGWSAQIYAQAVEMAPFTRERFTFLDVEAG